MKNLLRTKFIKISFFFLIGMIVFLLALNYFILPWYVSRPETKVPNVVGLKETEAFALLEKSELQPIISDTTFDQKYPEGTIILQKPESGKTVKEGRNIYLFISGGEPTVIVPVLKGKSIREAKFTLERIGLKLGDIEETVSNHPRNMIFDQQYAEGTPLKKGASVGVSISVGEGETGEIIVPDLIGKSVTEAERILSDSTLKVGKINYQRSFSLLPNTILDQYPSKGNKVNRGDAVDLFVTKSAEQQEEIKEQ